MSQKIKTSVEIDGSLTASQIANATTDTDKFLVSDGGTVKYRTGAELASDLGIASGSTSKVQHQVKAGVAINKGQAVYVTSADGTNMIVGLASNASEATSSKTMGLLNATVAVNDFADVITEGLLDGLNTSAAAVGDPVWLGTGGNLIYGLANKPYAPNHLVFIGIVTRVNANNGEIFVKVQNGFELDEIHDVDLKTTTKVNGHLLGYNGSLWVNKTIAEWLGYTPYNASNPAGYISSYTETDTLASVTARGASTSSNITITNTAPSFTFTSTGLNRSATLGITDGANMYISAASNGNLYLGSGTTTFINGSLSSDTELRAPIFYDSNNTAYYVDPASTSNLNALNIGNAKLRWGGNTTPTLGLPFSGSANAFWIDVNDGDTGGLMVDNEGVTVYGAGDNGYVFRVIDEDVYQATTNVASSTTFQVSQGQNGGGFIKGNFDISGTLTASGYNKTNWDTAYGWGNHASAGYALANHTHIISAIAESGISPNGISIQAGPGSSNTQGWTYPYGTKLSAISGAGRSFEIMSTTYPDGQLVLRTLGSGGVWDSWKTILDTSNYSTYAVPTSRTITINGTSYDLSANRSWTVTASETDTLQTVTSRGATTNVRPSFDSGITVNGLSYVTANGYFVSGAQGFRWNDSSGNYNNVIMRDNGTTWFRNYLETPDSMRSPIYYDYNDTSYYGDFNSTTRQYQAISFGDSSRYSAINTTINGAGAGDKLILYGGVSNYDARLLVGADYDMLFKSQGNSAGKGSFKFYSGLNSALALTIDATQGLRAGTSYNNSPAGTYFSHTLSGVGTNRVVNFDGNGTTPSVWWTNGARAYGAIDAKDPGMNFWANNGSSWQQQMEVNYGNVTINTDIRSPIFYDSNNTGYYVDPNSGSNLNNVTANEFYTNGWFRNNTTNTGLYNQVNGNHIYSRQGKRWGITGNDGAGSVWLDFYGNHESTYRGSVHADTSNNIGFLANDGGWGIRTVANKNVYVHGNTLYVNADNQSSSNIIMQDSDHGDRQIHCNSNRIGFLNQSGGWGSWCEDNGDFYSAGTSIGVGAMQAPVFYDYNNTAYYWEPATDASHRFQTPYGYIDIGPKNTSYCHIYTDRGSFYFNAQLDVLGNRVLNAGNYSNYAWPLEGGWKPASLASSTRLRGATSPDGGEFGLAYSGGQIHPYADGFFYQNEGAYRVIDTNSVGSYAVLARTQSNWAGSGVIDNVVGLLSWKNYGSSHVIFDASNGTTPSGTSCSTTNPQNNWASSYPTLMGWNGSNTYGVRVDVARYADSAGSAGSATNATNSDNAGHLRTAYVGGVQSNPQVYFNNTIGLKAAMTGHWSVWSDTLWINGYSGGDVPNMCALHFLRNGTPRMAISTQSFSSSSYGTIYEVLSNYGGTGTYSTTGDFRAPIFYDTNDTGYYVDPASTSNLKFLQVGRPSNGQSGTRLLGGQGTSYGAITLDVDISNYGTGIKINNQSSTYANSAMAFFYNGSQCGGVSIGVNSTAYNTSSDYRLKENVVPIESPIVRLKELNPCRFNFINEPSKTVDGFIAHEVQEIIPEAVTGTKDELDYDGTPKHQGIDQSKIVPLLTAALQEAIAKIEELENRLSTLENK